MYAWMSLSLPRIGVLLLASSGGCGNGGWISKRVARIEKQHEVSQKGEMLSIIDSNTVVVRKHDIISVYTTPRYEVSVCGTLGTSCSSYRSVAPHHVRATRALLPSNSAKGDNQLNELPNIDPHHGKIVLTLDSRDF